jgi:hypothetical protein
MDPLNLLKELYGEEPIRKIMSSGFDSLSKIAAATPESLSFFAGIQEALARQIIESAEGGRTAAGLQARAHSVVSAHSPELSRPSSGRRNRRAPTAPELLDERPSWTPGGTQTLSGTHQGFLNDDDFLAEVG